MDTLSCLSEEAAALLERHQLLKPLVKAELIRSALAAISVDSEQEQQLLNNFWLQQGIADESGFSAWLDKTGSRRELVLEQLTAPLRLSAYCNDKFGHRAEVRFLERKQQLDQVVYSLIRVKDPFQARELYLQIAEGEADFGSIATQFSQGRENQTRGVVGPVPLIQAHPKLVELLRSSKPGELREPIVVEDWNLIVRLESFQPAVLDGAMEQRMAHELFAEWIDEEVGRRLKDLFAGFSAGKLSSHA